MRGRRPTPTAIRLLRGNVRGVNGDEPQHAPLAADAPPPDVIADNDLAADEWRRVLGALVDARQVTSVDEATLTAYCVAFARWRQLEAKAASVDLVVATASGYLQPNPWITLAAKTCRDMVRYAIELGITPSSRSKVTRAAEGRTTPVDAFTAFQRKRRQPGRA